MAGGSESGSGKRADKRRHKVARPTKSKQQQIDERLAGNKKRSAEWRAQRQCEGIKKDGTRCKSWKLHGSKFCMGHQPEEVRAEAGMAVPGSAGKSARPRERKVPELMRLVAEEAAEHILAPHFKALGVKLQFNEDGSPHIEYDDSGGVKLFGVSKDGDVFVSEHTDVGGQIAAAEKILDRVWGKSKQSHELAGPGGGPVRVEVPRSSTRAAEVARILSEAGALPGSATPAQHEGRQRRLPPQRPVAGPASEQSSNGHDNGAG